MRAKALVTADTEADLGKICCVEVLFGTLWTSKVRHTVQPVRSVAQSWVRLGYGGQGQGRITGDRTNEMKLRLLERLWRSSTAQPRFQSLDCRTWGWCVPRLGHAAALR